MKKIFFLMLFCGCLFAEGGTMSKAHMATMLRFNRLYDSIYVNKVFHGSDSLKADKRIHGLQKEISKWK